MSARRMSPEEHWRLYGGVVDYERYRPDAAAPRAARTPPWAPILRMKRALARRRRDWRVSMDRKGAQ